MSPDPSSKPAGSDLSYTVDCDEPIIHLVGGIDVGNGYVKALVADTDLMAEGTDAIDEIDMPSAVVSTSPPDSTRGTRSWPTTNPPRPTRATARYA